MFSAVAEQLGMDYQTAVKVSCGFAGGMYLGSVCGAVTGGIMAIGLKQGGAARQSSLQTAMTVRQFTDRFKEKHKSVNCPDLVGVDVSKVDISNPAALNELYKSALAKTVTTVCAAAVKDAATIVTQILAEGSTAD